ncbi:hypothetical protein B0H14DRAFT_2592907 [Mycena olivaceomarginata]|nr:hypothetical protein B0H14DRAFT_2592907 [Mycena olivaceomarginata]
MWCTTGKQKSVSDEWGTTIKLTDKKNRVGLALVFKDHVLAFLKNDLVSPPTWTTTHAALLPSPPDFCSPKWGFLDSLAGWIRHRAESEDVDQNGLACNVIQGESTVFLGIDVYIVNELFFLAGKTLFSVLPSQPHLESRPVTAANRSGGVFESILHRLLRWCIPRVFKSLSDWTQRLKYQDWLHVYAKDRAQLPSRMAALVDLYFLFPFHTILDISSTGDILKPDLMDQPTFMRPEHYIPLLLEPEEMGGKSRPHCPIHTYSAKKQLWSITLFPHNSQGDSTIPCEITGEVCQHMLFSYIVTRTRNVAIGPLEYCGNAHLVHIGSAAVIAKELGIQKAGYDKAVSRKRAHEGDENQELEVGHVQPKKARLSADKHLVLATKN